MSDLQELYQSIILDHNRRPKNYGALMNLYSVYAKSGHQGKARETLTTMAQLFPNDREVSRLMSSQK